MAEYYLGQVMLTGFGYAQKGFAMCNGQLLPIAQNQALFSLLGVTYGGNGTNTFALPNLMGRTPIGQGRSPMDGSTYNMGQAAGTEQVTLNPTQMPQHNHAFMATDRAGAIATPTTPPGIYAAATLAAGGTENIYAPPASGTDVALLPAAVGPAGGNLPHQNMQPFRVINFNIALTGIYPSRS